MPKVQSMCLAAVLLGLPGLAGAQNFLSNGDFDSDLSGWSSSGPGSAVYSSSAGSPSVGAAHLTVNDPSGNGLTETVNQCIAVGSNAGYTVAGRTLADPASTAAVGMFVIARFFSSFDCTTGILSTTLTPSTGTATGTPSDFTTYSGNITAPSTARSLIIFGQVQTNSAGTAEGWVDHLSVTSTDVIFVDSFEQL